MMSRADRTPLTDWWWTVDRGLLAGLGALMVAGLVFLMGGGPPVAERIGLRIAEVPVDWVDDPNSTYLTRTVGVPSES